MAVLLNKNNAAAEAAMAQQHHHQHQQTKANTAANNASLSPHHQQRNPSMFHDFLGIKPAAGGGAGVQDPSVALPSTAALAKADDVRLSEASPAASAGASSGGGRGGPISTTSDLGSERQISNHFEGVPFYGPRSDISGHDMSNRLVRSKRSSSDSTFMGSARDGLAQLGPESHENLHVMKMLRNGPGGERQRRYSEDEAFIGTHALRQASTSFLLHPGVSSRNDPVGSKWDHSIPMNLGSNLQFPPRGGQFGPPLGHHIQQNRLREVQASGPIISQSAADEGSRTGMKGPSILSSINAAGSGPEKNLPVGPQIGGKPRPDAINTDSESSNPPSRNGTASMSRQMTIFYGGQAHVFDDVHPNKAEIIMALAGSNGGSWSTTFSPKSSSRPASEGNIVIGDNETAGMPSLARDLRGKFPAIGNSGHGPETTDRISNALGGSQSGIVAKDPRNPSLAGPDEKRDGYMKSKGHQQN